MSSEESNRSDHAYWRKRKEKKDKFGAASIYPTLYGMREDRQVEASFNRFKTKRTEKGEEFKLTFSDYCDVWLEDPQLWVKRKYTLENLHTAYRYMMVRVDITKPWEVENVYITSTKEYREEILAEDEEFNEDSWTAEELKLIRGDL